MPFGNDFLILYRVYMQAHLVIISCPIWRIRDAIYVWIIKRNHTPPTVPVSHEADVTPKRVVVVRFYDTVQNKICGSCTVTGMNSPPAMTLSSTVEPHLTVTSLTITAACFVPASRPYIFLKENLINAATPLIRPTATF